MFMVRKTLTASSFSTEVQLLPGTFDALKRLWELQNKHPRVPEMIHV